MLKMKGGHVFAAFLMLAATSLLSDCNNNKTQATGPVTPAATPAPASSPSSPSSSSSGSSSPAGSIATQGEFPGITLAVQEIKRGSNTLTLKFVVANQSAKNFFPYYYFFETEAHSVDGVHLIDPVNKKKYFVVRDSDGAPLCSRQLQDIVPGAQSVLWAKFPAPPDDVQKMTVEIPHFPPLEDVPVSR